MYRRLVTSIVMVAFAGILFSGVFSVFSSSLQSLQQNLSNVAQSSVLAY